MTAFFAVMALCPDFGQVSPDPNRFQPHLHRKKPSHPANRPENRCGARG